MTPSRRCVRLGLVVGESAAVSPPTYSGDQLVSISGVNLYYETYFEAFHSTGVVWNVSMTLASEKGYCHNSKWHLVLAYLTLAL